MADNPIVSAILARLREIREARNLTPAELDERLIFGPGWVERIESGQTVPALDVLVVMLNQMESTLDELLAGIDTEAEVEETTTAVDRFIWAAEDEESGDLHIHFQYADHDAVYKLSDASLEQFDAVIRTLRDGLARLVAPQADDRQVKTRAVADAFNSAMDFWPTANPSDLWWFVVSRAYLDPYNHPARYARLDLGQSWKRTGGWALEEVLVDRYRDALAAREVHILIARGDQKQLLLQQLQTSERLEADKVDVFLVGQSDAGSVCFGVVHVKASFAERRTDDVPMSRALVEAGYCSPLWTMDSKGTPSATPVNRGELGRAREPGADRRSAKRKDIEDDGFFSACFSYNRNTVPTPAEQGAASLIHVCDFQSPEDDVFTTFIADAWERFREANLTE